MQTLLFYACCFTDKSQYYKSKLASFTEDPGYHRLSLCMSFACRTAAKLGPCCQPCFTVTGLLLHRRLSCATSAFCAIEAVHRKVCWLTCCVRKDRRLSTDLRFALASSWHLLLVRPLLMGPTVEEVCLTCTSVECRIPMTEQITLPLLLTQATRNMQSCCWFEQKPILQQEEM